MLISWHLFLLTQKQLSDVVDKKVVRKDVCDKLVKNLDAIDNNSKLLKK